MDIDKLIRDPKKIHSDLEYTKDDKIITKTGCKIIIPERYQLIDLANLETDIYIIGIFCIIIDDKYYGVSKVPSMMKILPASISTIKIDNENYLEFVFHKGEIVVDNIKLIKNINLLYPIFKEFVSNGNVPWYINYEDFGSLFELSQKYTGRRLGANNAIFEMIVAVISRNSRDLTKSYRYGIKNLSDIHTDPPTVIKIGNVTYGATNTTAKLIGGYWEDGLVSALINPTDKVEPIENLLRK